MKTHLITVPQPIEHWPEVMKALCGVEVSNPSPVLIIDADEGSLEATSTVLFCKVCAILATVPAEPRVRYVYGVLPAEQAYQLSQNKDGD